MEYGIALAGKTTPGRQQAPFAGQDELSCNDCGVCKLQCTPAQISNAANQISSCLQYELHNIGLLWICTSFALRWQPAFLNIKIILSPVQLYRWHNSGSRWVRTPRFVKSFCQDGSPQISQPVDNKHTALEVPYTNLPLISKPKGVPVLVQSK